eukprot:10559886-Alexandrium_andersonii.AAC.1
MSGGRANSLGTKAYTEGPRALRQRVSKSATRHRRRTCDAQRRRIKYEDCHHATNTHSCVDLLFTYPGFLPSWPCHIVS